MIDPQTFPETEGQQPEIDYATMADAELLKTYATGYWTTYRQRDQPLEDAYEHRARRRAMEAEILRRMGTS